jgi:hypothetical protein
MGPGANLLTIDGSQLPTGYTGYNDSRLFTHTGTGYLKIGALTLTGGHSNHSASGYPALGGCVYSAGSVGVYQTNISACTSDSLSDKAEGGAIYAKGVVNVKYSVISGNSAFAGAQASGGGVRAVGNLRVKYSTIDGNSTFSSSVSDSDDNTFKYAVGGGVSSAGNITLRHSTISNNTTNGSFAGVDGTATFANASSRSMYLYSSTISGNHADQLVGGIYSNNGSVEIDNSTIAFNTAAKMRIGMSPSYQFFGPGLALSTSAATDVAVNLQSSLFSNNTYGGSSEFDITTALDSTDPMQFNVTFNAGPANNLVRTSFTSNPLPSGTLKFSCPLLGQLRDNGGLTKTHALLSTSVAIDAGNNIKDESEDQRGTGTDPMPYPYPRVSNGTPDIGAFEVNQDDTIFDAAFEGCPILF